MAIVTTVGHTKIYITVNCHMAPNGHKNTISNEILTLFLDFFGFYIFFGGIYNFFSPSESSCKKKILLAIMAIAATLDYITGDLKIIQTNIAYVYFRPVYLHQHT